MPPAASAPLGDPGLTITRSNRAEHLAAVLGATLKTAPNPDPIAPEVVLIGNKGMERWLSHHLAEDLGVCANVQFLFPARVLDAELQWAQPPGAPPAGAAWQPDALAWTLAEALPGLLAELPPALAAPLRGALGPSALLDPAAPVIDRRAWALCAELARVFDRVVAYRPELAQAWSRGEGASTAAIPWQPLLWREVVRRVGSEHIAARLERALPRWQRGEAVPHHRRLHLFGLSVLPPAWIAQLLAMARSLPIHLYLLAPSSAWWADLATRARGRVGLRALEGEDALLEALGLDEGADGLHPLLRTLGRVPRDLQLLLADLDAAQDETLPVGLDPVEVMDTGDAFFGVPIQGAAPTLLEQLQLDLLSAEHPGPARSSRPPVAPTDLSVQVHACHGLLRQVEVLYDALLHALSDDPALEPRDVVVLCPDIEAAAPLVQAVFGGRGARGGPPPLPFKIADLSERRLNPVADVLLRTVELAQGRAPASAVLDLLELEPIQRRFGLDADDVRRCAGLIQEAGVRCAVDDLHRAAFPEQPAELANTWRFGLERLLLGALTPDEDELLDGIAPMDKVDPAAAAAVGRLAGALAALFSALDELRAPRPITAWCDTLERQLAALTAMDPDGAWLVRRVREGIDELRAQAKAAGSVAAVQAEALRAAITGRFEVPAEPTGLQSGAVTFCALQPMRSVPYKIVALLGMDDGAFPRQTPRLGFDPTRLRPRPGDRSPRDEDRYLFLEAVLAARDQLLVLFSGRDERSNDERPPAVPVSELLDALEATAPGPDGGPLRPHLLRTHSLQAFHPDNFRPRWPGAVAPTARPWSFSPSLRAGAAALRGEREAVEDEAPTVLRLPRGPAAPQPDEEIELDDLVRFFENPARALLQRRLRVQLPPAPAAVADREPVELDALERWGLGEALLAGAQAGDGAPAARAAAAEARARAEGRLPFGQSGSQAVARERQLSEAIVFLAEAFAGPTLPAEDLRLSLPGVEGGPPWAPAPAQGVQLIGRVGPLRRVAGLDGSVLLRANVGREDGKRLLRVVLPHLLRLAASADPAPRAVLAHGSVVSGAPKPELKGFGAPPGDARAWARAQLARLVQLYRAGQRAPLPLLPQASLEFAKALGGAVSEAFFIHSDPPPLSPAAEEALRGALGKAVAYFDSPGTAAFGALDVDDPWFARAHQGRDPLRAPGRRHLVQPAFALCALWVWGPVLSLRRTTKEIVADGAPRPW
ncbi:MAG: exodeoxyribonuclease V subunit gamma [Deltaproteobacteria bacterium]|nr:exodeoxyribonuclease V subunit gamma [Deltaproteobacteria bacterium]